MTEEPHMWTYWRDDKGLKEALRYQYPETLASDKTLQALLMQITTAEIAIDAIMKKRQTDAEDLTYD